MLKKTVESFSDEDLKRLKIDIEAWISPYWKSEKLKALLARMQAAERYCESGVYKDRIAWKVSKGELTGKIKAAGKEGR